MTTLRITEDTPASAINAFVDANSRAQIVFAANGVINVDGTIRCPNHKKIVIRSEGVATVRLTDPTPNAALFELTGSGAWDGEFGIAGLGLIANAGPNQHCIASSQGRPVNHGRITVEKLRLNATGYEIYCNNQEYSIAPIFRELRGSNGFYWSGATHSASNLLLENCRFHNSVIGPQVYIFGARKWTIRNVICESSEPLRDDIDPNAPDVMNTRGFLIRNPGPDGGIIESCWNEFWGKRDEFYTTIEYSYDGGGANKASCVYLKNTSAHKFQALNSSSQDAMAIYIEAGSHDLPNFDDESDFRVTGKTSVFVSGGVLPRAYTFGNPKVKVVNAQVSGAHWASSHLSQQPFVIYQYRGGTGVYDRSAVGDWRDWQDSRPYVQHHPEHGHSLVIKRDTDKLKGVAFSMPLRMPKDDYIRQHFASIAPHLEKVTGSPSYGQNGYGAGMVDQLNNAYAYRDGFAPEHCIGIVDATADSLLPMFHIKSHKTSQNGKWLQFFDGVAASGDLAPLVAKPHNYDCYEWPNDPGPPKGTSIAGDECRPLDPTSDTHHWLCTVAGTSRPINVTADVTVGSDQLTNISDVTELLPGDFISIGGDKFRVMQIDSISDSATLDSAAKADGVGVAVINSNPAWSERRFH